MIFKQTKNKKLKENKNLRSKFLSLLTTHYSLPTNNGFLLVEMIVSVALFSVVMMIGIGSLLNMIDVNRRAQSFTTVVNNINLAIESMSREIRTGYNYNCESSSGGDCSGGEKSLYFTSSSGENIVYRFDNNKIEKNVNGNGFIPIIADDISVSNLKFFVLGTDPYPGDEQQPRVTIVVQANIESGPSGSVGFGLYTTISQRQLDN